MFTEKEYQEVSISLPKLRADRVKGMGFHMLRLESQFDIQCPRSLIISKKSTHLIKSLNLNNKKAVNKS